MKLKRLKRVDLPPEEKQFRQEVRQFLQERLQGLAPDVRARSWMGFDASFSRDLARKGWLGLTLDKKYGGAGRGYYSRFVLSEELLCAGAPVSAHWIADRQSGPLIQRYGTPEQCEFYLPKIAQAHAFFCIGMSEPNSGSDLASIRTKAVKTEGGWLVSGSKIWTTNAHRSHYMLALVRTSGSAQDRYIGLSQIIIDLSAPGVTIRPIADLTGDTHFSEVFFDEVFCPSHALVGKEGQGWEQVNAELAFERSGPERLYSSMVLVETWLAYCRQLDHVTPQTQRVLGQLSSWLMVLRAMSLSLTDLLAQGESPVVEAALVKDLGTEIEQAIPRLIAEVLRSEPDRVIPIPLWRTLIYLEQVAPTFSLRGGTREILRGIIARGLGLR